MASSLGPASEPRFRFGLAAVTAIVLILAALRLYIAGHSGLVFDEGYYTFWSERLATGYLDHPPAVAVLIALGRALVGNTELGVRLFAVVCGVGTSLAIWRIGMLLLDRPIAALAVLLYNVTPASGLGFIMTPDPPSILCWAAVLWAVAEFMVSGRAFWWLVAGVLAGLGLWSKYTDAFLAPGLLLFLLTAPERRGWLKRWQVWAAPVLAVVVFAPVIQWNAARDWASFRFQGGRTVANGLDPHLLGNLSELLAGQMLYAGPVLAALALVGIVAFFFRRNAVWARLALPVWTTLPALAYFVFHTLHTWVEANWLLPLWPALTLIGAAAAMALWHRASRVAFALVALQLLLGVALTAVVYAQALWQPFSLAAIDRTSETRGWPALEREVTALAAANGTHWIATASNFAQTGELASYSLFAGSPLPVRQIDEPMRWAFLPPIDPATIGWPALFVRVDWHPDRPKPPTDLFGEVHLVGILQRTGGKGPLDSWAAFVVSAPTAKFMAGIGR